jgi:hypothetical protein
MDLNERIALGGLISLIAGSLAIWTFFHPNANAMTSLFDRMFQTMTFTKGVASPRVMCLIGGIVGVCVGLIGLAQAFGVIHL